MRECTAREVAARGMRTHVRTMDRICLLSIPGPYIHRLWANYT